MDLITLKIIHQPERELAAVERALTKVSYKLVKGGALDIPECSANYWVPGCDKKSGVRSQESEWL